MDIVIDAEKWKGDGLTSLGSDKLPGNNEGEKAKPPRKFPTSSLERLIFRLLRLEHVRIRWEGNGYEEKEGEKKVRRRARDTYAGEDVLGKACRKFLWKGPRGGSKRSRCEEVRIEWAG